MASYNKVFLMGNITRDIELRYTPSGVAVAELGMAMNRVRKGEDGGKIEEVTFADVTLWGNNAELASKYLAKGRSVFIEGRLQMDTWEDKATGKQRSKLKVVGELMQFTGNRGDSQQKSEPQQPNNGQAMTKEDIPF